jgi:hypothetical protein
MKLSTARHNIEDVTEQGVEQVFDADDSLWGEFVILEIDKDTFLQAGGEASGPFNLEYKEAGKHFHSVRPLSKQEVKEASIDYFRGGSSWRTKHEWKEMAFQKGCFQQSAATLLLVALMGWTLIR